MIVSVSTKEVYGYTEMKLGQLNRNASTGAGKAVLAEIRRGVGKAPGELPKTWGILFQGMPEKMYSANGEPTRAEWAVYTALTLYALHQQGSDPAQNSMNQKDMRLGVAVSRLCRNAEGRYTDEDRERIARRFMPLATAGSMPELTHHLRAIVQLLKTEGIPLDYPALAADLYRYQFEESENQVRLQWGQDFYRYNNESEENSDEN